MPHTHDDVKHIGFNLSANDGAAMGSYIERYVYDMVGNILEMQHHDRVGVRAGWVRGYSYQASSNRLSSTTIGRSRPEENTYSYDAHGNVTHLPHLSMMQWNYNDQLSASSRQVINSKASSDKTPETTFYVYDASGRRIRQITESYAGEAKIPVRRKERLYLGGFEIYRRYKNDGHTVDLERETLHIMDDSKRIALVETRTKGQDQSPKQLIRYQLSNHLDSCSLELDDNARTISYEEYTPFGSTSYQAVSQSVNTPKRYRYSGKERDDSTGLYYYGERYYASWLGRWMSPDPAGTVDGLNLYAFVGGSPITYFDGEGMVTKNANNSKNPKVSHQNLASVARQVGSKKRQRFEMEEETKQIDQMNKVARTIMSGVEPKPVSNVADAIEKGKFDRMYRELLSGQDELISTSLTREIIKGVIDNKKIKKIGDYKTLNKFIDVMSSVRFPTKWTGFAHSAVSGNDRMQHPAGKEGGIWIDSAKQGPHYRLDLQRKDVVLKAMQTVQGNLEAFLKASIAAAVIFTLNNMTAPAMASDQYPVETDQQVLVEQTMEREKLKKLGVWAGAEMDQTESPNTDINRPWGDRTRKRRLSLPRIIFKQ